MKVESGFKQMFRSTLSAGSGQTKVQSQDDSMLPIGTLRTKLGEKALYDPSVLRLPAFFGTGGISSDQLRLRPPEKSSTPPHEVSQAIRRVKDGVVASQDPRLQNLVNVLETLEGFQRSLRPKITNYEG